MPFTPAILAAAGVVLTGLLVTSGPEQPAPSDRPAGLVSMPAEREVAAEREPSPARGSWPLLPPPPVVTAFDRPETRWSAGHRGADLLGRPGQPVRAALAGTVSYVGRIAGRGIVSVDHGATRTTYQPVAATVSRGQRVSEGQMIGRLLLAGSHCHPRACLHWGLIRGASTYLDPLTLVGAVPQPVRLLPW